MVLLLTAFRLAWPAFAYSIEDDGEAQRTYAYVLTYLVLVTTGSPLRSRSSRPGSSSGSRRRRSQSSSRVVGPLAFSTVAFAGYIVVAIGVGRAQRTQFNWVVTGAAAAVNVALNLLADPALRDDGRRDRDRSPRTRRCSSGMAWWAQRIYPVPYQWRRVADCRRRRRRARRGRQARRRRASRRARCSRSSTRSRCFPLGFYLPAERKAIGARLRALAALGDDPVHLEALGVLAVHVHAVHAGEVPDVLGIGVAPVLLRGVARERRDLPLDVALLERDVGAVREVEVVPGDLVAEDRRPLEGAQALLGDRLVILVDVVVRRLEDDVRLATPPRARRAARGCPGGARGRCARRSRAR